MCAGWRVEKADERSGKLLMKTREMRVAVTRGPCGRSARLAWGGL